MCFVTTCNITKSQNILMRKSHRNYAIFRVTYICFSGVMTMLDQHNTRQTSSQSFFLASGSDQTTDMQPWVSMHRRIKAFLKLSSAAGCVPLLCAAAARKEFFLLLGFFLKHDAASCKLRLSLVAAPLCLISCLQQTRL